MMRQIPPVGTIRAIRSDVPSIAGNSPAFLFNEYAMTLNQIWQQGYDAAICGVSVSDCPYRGEKKRAWVIGFIQGLKTSWSQK
ncbi:MAG: hypothetical protein E7B59_13455 [Enterobacteriaceae bacterium]|nr:hypothetical protein [Enterobacteriaceae bacterium]